MLERTFCHMPGVGARKERQLWEQGVRTWQDALAVSLPGKTGASIQAEAARSLAKLEARDGRYFAPRVPAREAWRLFPAFADRVAYLDIETTGLGQPGDHVTTIVMYDGEAIRHYVHGDNMDAFGNDVQGYELLVTFNGKSFDVPFIRKFLDIDIDIAHIDLMHVLRSLGYRGGLKAIERTLGYERYDMADIDGYFAVVLWRAFEATGDERVLETLLAYNAQDVLNLEALMAVAFNGCVDRTPFGDELHMLVPTVRANPFRAHRDVVDRLKYGMGVGHYITA